MLAKLIEIDTEKFVEKIAKAEAVPIVDTNLRLIRQSNTTYIPTMMDYEDNNSPFCIVSAPGATGKSALCDFLAHETRGVVWNLANISIGEQFVEGTFYRLYKNTYLPKVEENRNNGKYTLILDALDEAEIVSGWNNIQIMLDDLVRLFPSTKANQIIIVSRNDTAECVASYLAEKDICCSRAWVKYFNNTQKQLFCKEYLQVCKRGVQGKQGYLDAIDNVIAQVDNIYNTASRQAQNSLNIDFTGYAPVLQAITQFVAEYDNPSKALGDFKTGTAISCIKKILHDILQREQKKFYDAFKVRVKNSLSLSEQTLYTPDEQMEYIVEKYISGSNPNINPPAELSSSSASEYVNTVNEFFPQHPFFNDGKFSGVAFRDYVLVKALFNQKTDSSNILYGSEMTFSPLLWEFYKDEGKTIKREVLGCLMESIISSGKKESSISFSIYDSSEGEGQIFEILQKDSEEKIPERYSIEKGTVPIILGSKLNHLECNTNANMCIGGRKETVCLGDTYLSCNSLDINADKIDILPSQGEKSVLVAKKCNSTVKNISGIGLEIYWDGGNTYPWSQYFCDDYAQGDDILTQKDWMKYLRAILRRFKKDGRNSFGKYKSQVDNIVVGNHKEKRLIVDFLKDVGIMREQKRPPEYIISVDAFNSFGLSFNSLLRADEPTSDSEKLYKKFMEYKNKHS